MQEFTIVVKLVANAVASVSEAEIRQEVQLLLDDFLGGTAEIETVTEQ